MQRHFLNPYNIIPSFKLLKSHWYAACGHENAKILLKISLFSVETSI